MALNLHEHVFIQGTDDKTLLLMHGTGGDERDLIPLARSLDPKASILSPRGNVNEGGALRFFKRLSEGVFDLGDVERRTKDLAAWIAAAIEHYGIDASALTAVGYSNGANAIAAMVLVHPTALKRAILLRAMVTVTPPRLPDLASTHVLMLNGERDPIIQAANAKRLAAMLKQAGAEVSHTMLECGHELIADDLRIADAWLHHLK